MDAEKKPVETFFDTQACGTCHVQYVDDWRGSYHEQLQEANQQTVLGNFKDVSFTDVSMASHFLKNTDFVLLTD